MSRPLLKSTCIICETPFETSSRTRAYCSGKCRCRAFKMRYGHEPQTPDTVLYRNDVLRMLARKTPQREIAKRLGIHRRTVERIVDDVALVAPREVKRYKCPECDKHGIHSLTTQRPCVVCVGRKARAGR